jgi:nitrite reductase/ring-hydroxylating ferredoxin subunit
MGRHVVCRADELAPGEGRLVEVENREIALFNLGDDFAAIGNRCPHEGASLCRGVVSGLACADEPGEYRMEREGELVRCPWHGWEFDVRTGQSWCDPRRMRVKAFDVSVERGEGLRKGPYQIDVYDVELDGDYVVLTV